MPNWFAFGLQLLSVLLLIFAASVPEWLQNQPISGSYPYHRRWGLFTVHGRQINSHLTTFDDACTAAAQQQLTFGCTHTLCNYLNSKCTAWRLIWVGSLTSAIFLFLTIIVSLVSASIQLKSSTRTAKASMVLSLIGIVCCTLSLGVYILIARTAFTLVNMFGYYPVPQPSTSLYLSLASCGLLFAAAVSHTSHYLSRLKEGEFTHQVRMDIGNAREFYGAA